METPPRQAGAAAERWAAGCALALGLYLLLEATRLRFGLPVRPGPGFYPTLVALGLTVSAAAILLRSFFSARPAPPVPFDPGARDVAVCVAALVFYGFVIEPVGYPIATVLLTLLLARGIGRLGWRMSLVLAVGGTAISFVVFKWLGIGLPPGPLAL